MAIYRIYLLNEAGHITKPPMEVDCESDEAAIASVQDDAHEHEIEIWLDDRRVASIAGATRDVLWMRSTAS